MAPTGRRSRLFHRAEEVVDDEDADLSEEEHAWWAAREEVAGVPRGTAPSGPGEGDGSDDGSHFSDYWTAESLFDEPVAAPEPEPAEAVEVPGSMDLDSAHLVLQVEVGEDWEGIVRAHRALAKQFHPDRLIAYSPDAQELGRRRMAEINEAHATLRALHFH